MLLARAIAFLVCFVVWVMLGVQLREDLQLKSIRFSLLISTPALTGGLRDTGLYRQLRDLVLAVSGDQSFVSALLSRSACPM